MTDTPTRAMLLIAGVIFCTTPVAQVSYQATAPTAPAESRGALLYTTHCVACHTTQMHWRDERQARDWDSLQFQVRRWQGNTGLQWTDADITEVSRYLNDTIYQYPQTANRVGFVSLPIRSSVEPR